MSYTKEKIEKQNTEKLSKVKPLLAEKCQTIIELARGEGFILIVTNGFRSIEEQNKLYAIGRRGIPGERKVTNAKGGESNHNSGDAVDFAFIVNGEVSWDEKLYKNNIGRWAKIVGLNWGGNWKSFKDFPHVEFE